VAVLTRAQARLLGLADPVLVPFCLDFSAYEPGEGAGGYLAWAGRISPEKGLANAARVAAAAGLPLHVAGGIEDDGYWREIVAHHGETVRHRGFLSTRELQSMLGGAVALLQTQEWQEAFGATTVEAMACGTPVVAYRRGANVELVKEGLTGRLVDPDDLEQALAAIERVRRIDRAGCRQTAEASFGLERLGAAYDDWFRRLGLA
jgi:UDP-glucose:tetrahydrobiopterin glucosyltransferase